MAKKTPAGPATPLHIQESMQRVFANVHQYETQLRALLSENFQIIGH
jgi:hypothetical protein